MHRGTPLGPTAGAPARASPLRTVGLVHLALALVLAAVSLAWFGMGVARANSSGASLELVGGEAPRTLQLSLERVHVGTASKLVLRGELYLGLRNVSKTARRVRLRYARNNRRAIVIVRHIRLAPGALRQVAVPFVLPATLQPATLDGNLIVEASAVDPQSHPGNDPLVVSVKAMVHPIGEIRFTPTTAVVQVTRGCVLVSCNEIAGGAVQLEGAGVGLLLAQLAAVGQTSLTGRVQDGPHVIGVELSKLKLEDARPGTASAELSLTSAPQPGKYSGSIPLSSLIANSPSLPIEVRSHVWFIWEFLLVAAGVFAGGYIYRSLGLRRRRLIQQRLLADAVSEYCDERSRNTVNQPAAGTELIRELESVSCPGPLEENPEWDYADLVKACDVYAAMKWARNDADLDVTEGAAFAIVRGIKGWLLALNQVRGLWDLAREPRQQQTEWDSTKVAQDTRFILIKAQHASPDGTNSTPLLEQVRQQTEWHRSFAEAWDLCKHLVEAGGRTAHSVGQERERLDELAEHATPIASRTLDQQYQLYLELETIQSRLMALRELSNKDTLTTEVELAPLSVSRLELRADALRLELGSLQSNRPAEFAQAAAAAGGALIAARPVAEELDVAHRAATPSATIAAPSQGKSALRPRARLLRRLKFWDTVTSLAIVLVVTLLYSPTVYSDTWGTLADIATAFAAGFSGQVVVKWGLLPAYRSLMLGASQKSRGEPEAEAAV